MLVGVVLFILVVLGVVLAYVTCKNCGELAEIQGLVARQGRLIEKLKARLDRVSANQSPSPREPERESTEELGSPVQPFSSSATAFPMDSEGAFEKTDSTPFFSIEATPEVEEPEAESPFPSKTEEAPRPPAVILVDWERFTGARLFAWIGGLALFLGMAFLVKYSIDQGLISPAIRVSLGFFVGVTSLSLGMWLGRKGYPITQHSLCAAGTAVLYVVVYASYDVYRFLGSGLAFPMMILITVCAFLLSVRLQSRYMALLGLAGGFLTPFLLSSGGNHPFGLFAYIALLDIGLAGVVVRMRWNFLYPLSAAASIAVLFAWTNTFFRVDEAFTAVIVWALFPALFASCVLWFRRVRKPGDSIVHTTGAISLLAMSFAFYLLTYSQLAARPGFVFGYLLLISLILSGLSLLESRFYHWQVGGGALAFLALMGWTAESLDQGLLGWALGMYLLFSLLHCGFPVLLQSLRPSFRPLRTWAGIFPLLMLLPFVRILSITGTVAWAVWFAVFLLNAVALACALTLGLAWLAIAFPLATLGLIWIQLVTIPASVDPFAAIWLIPFFSLAFFGLGLFFSSRWQGQDAAGGGTAASAPGWSSGFQLSVFSALLPFFLLATAIIRLPLVNPAQVFCLALLLVGLVYVVVACWRVEGFCLLALAGVSLLEWAWLHVRFDPVAPAPTFFWNILFWLCFLIVPLLLQARLSGQRFVWWAAGLAGPVHFLLIYTAAKQSVATTYIGLLPAAFALVYLLVLGHLNRTLSATRARRSELIALFAGVSLFFITLIFPVQLEKHWLTVGWALEGLALVWLYRRVPCPQLKKWGAALLILCFVRLALIPEVLLYSPRGEIPLVNWYLYGYGIVLTCLLVAARIWVPQTERFGPLSVRPVLYTMSTILAFLLLNIEVTDYFSSGPGLVFQFGRSLAQDLSYSLSWALFGLALLAAGIRTGSKAARLAALSLIAVTTSKLFLWDLWYLEQLYRVAAFVGLASVLVMVSYLYQRHVVPTRTGHSISRAGADEWED